uniref:Thiamine-biosynthesis n=1 Tax=Sciadococcus taiwanensis TaxID=3028030 RepID=A0A9Y1I1Y9_9RHOD|nr:thiamine-biosynthesis [Sciadococcus taiwanensis]
MSKTITVNINGRPYSCKEQLTLYNLVTYLNFNPQLVAVEYNRRVISNNLLGSVKLKNEDSVEIVTIVGGG